MRHVNLYVSQSILFETFERSTHMPRDSSDELAPMDQYQDRPFWALCKNTQKARVQIST